MSRVAFQTKIDENKNKYKNFRWPTILDNIYKAIDAVHSSHTILSY